MALVDRQPEFIAFSVVGCLLALITTLARMYSRVFIVRNVGADDYLMTVAMVRQRAVLVVAVRLSSLTDGPPLLPNS